jgi:hypothetical protein
VPAKNPNDIEHRNVPHVADVSPVVWKERAMNRRRLVAAIVSTLVVAPRLAEARYIPPVEFDPEDFAAVSYSDGVEEAPIRSLSVRVSRWADVEAAEAHRQATITVAGSDLPDGEFYQTDPVAYPVPAELVDFSSTIMGWNTTIGVAVYRTEWALLAVRRETLVWDLQIGGAEVKPVLDLAGTMAIDLVKREIAPSLDRGLWSLLPDEADVPEGLTLEDRMSPDGTFDAQGTPVAIGDIAENLPLPIDQD